MPIIDLYVYYAIISIIMHKAANLKINPVFFLPGAVVVCLNLTEVHNSFLRVLSPLQQALACMMVALFFELLYKWLLLAVIKH